MILNYLLTMPIYNLTQEKETEYNELAEKSPENIWLEELDTLETKYNKWYEKKLEDSKDTIVKKKKVKSKK